jgi:hypothetical protein
MGDKKPYVRGHILQNQMFTWGAAPEMASNFYSNIAPQLGAANHPFWYKGAEEPMISKVFDPRNEAYEFYVVNGIGGGLNHSSGLESMMPTLYPTLSEWPSTARTAQFLGAVPAFWWIAFIKVDGNGNVHESGGFIGDNFMSMTSANERSANVDSFSTLSAFEQALRQRCGNCKVNTFPGWTRTPPQDDRLSTLQPMSLGLAPLPQSSAAMEVDETAVGQVLVGDDTLVPAFERMTLRQLTRQDRRTRGPY